MQERTIRIEEEYYGSAYMPKSEACVERGIAGKPMNFQFIDEMIQLLDDEMNPTGDLLLPGEAGVYQDSKGYYYTRKERPAIPTVEIGFDCVHQMVNETRKHIPIFETEDPEILEAVGVVCQDGYICDSRGIAVGDLIIYPQVSLRQGDNAPIDMWVATMSHDDNMEPFFMGIWSGVVPVLLSVLMKDIYVKILEGVDYPDMPDFSIGPSRQNFTIQGGILE